MVISLLLLALATDADDVLNSSLLRFLPLHPRLHKVALVHPSYVRLGLVYAPRNLTIKRKDDITLPPFWIILDNTFAHTGIL